MYEQKKQLVGYKRQSWYDISIFGLSLYRTVDLSGMLKTEEGRAMSVFLQLALGVFLFVLSLILLSGMVSVLICWLHWLKADRVSSTELLKNEE